MPGTLIVGLIVVTWLFVLAPLALRGHKPVRHAGRAFNQVRVVHRGGDAPAEENSPLGRREMALRRRGAAVSAPEQVVDDEVFIIDDLSPAARARLEKLSPKRGFARGAGRVDEDATGASVDGAIDAGADGDGCARGVADECEQARAIVDQAMDPRQVRRIRHQQALAARRNATIFRDNDPADGSSAGMRVLGAPRPQVAAMTVDPVDEVIIDVDSDDDVEAPSTETDTVVCAADVDAADAAPGGDTAAIVGDGDSENAGGQFAYDESYARPSDLLVGDDDDDVVDDSDPSFFASDNTRGDGIVADADDSGVAVDTDHHDGDVCDEGIVSSGADGVGVGNAPREVTGREVVARRRSLPGVGVFDRRGAREESLTQEDLEFAARRRGRGGFDPAADARRCANRYQRRRRVLATLLAIVAVSTLVAVVVGSYAWIAPAVTVALTVVYLVALRRQVHAERKLRQHRIEQIRRARLGVTTSSANAWAIPARLRRPGGVVVEIDDDSPDFVHLPAASTPESRQGLYDTDVVDMRDYMPRRAG